ncbi:hypothetical protein Q3G72_005108 [Acer saccharum]|nr:hypothetical protein Q3G72_005108 [Acer saccharum]
MISPPTVISAKGTDCNLNLGTASFVTAWPRHTEVYVSSIDWSQKHCLHALLSSFMKVIVIGRYQFGGEGGASLFLP